MDAHTTTWDTGAPIPGTVFRQLVTAADTGGRFSLQSAVIRPRELVVPHVHRDEDEFTLVLRGKIGGRVGDDDVEVEEGGILFKPRALVHALWNPTDTPAVVLEIISPAGFEGFFAEMGALAEGFDPEQAREIAARYGQTPHPELVPELSERYGVAL